MSNNNPGIFATFYLEPVQQMFKTEQAGRPIFEDREFVKIVIAGDKNSEVHREATPNDMERFHEVYARFKAGMAGHDQVVGTPLSAWARLTPSMIREFQALNIFTVEHLSELSDTVKQNIGMGANELVAAAKAYLASATDGALAQALASENERLKADIDDLRAQIADIGARIPLGDDRKAIKPARAHEAA